MKRTFTLAEVIVAVFIISLVGGALFSSITYTMRTLKKIENMRLANNAIRSMIKIIEKTPYGSLPSGFDITDADGTVISGFTGVITLSSEIIGGREVEIAVRFTKPNELPIGQSCGANCSQLAVTIFKSR